MDKITLHYFIVGDKVTRGLGENVKLLLEDAGLDHDYVRSVRDEKWEELKAQLVKEGVHSCTQPYIQVNGQKFFKTVPIMRYISAKLDYKYHGSTPEENHLLDVITELADSWFNSMRAAFYSSDEQKKHHIEVETPEYLAIFEKYYNDRDGPYILGDKITFPDFLVYHLIDNDFVFNRFNDYPSLKKFVEAFEQRPNIKKYLASLPQ